MSILESCVASRCSRDAESGVTWSVTHGGVAATCCREDYTPIQAAASFISAFTDSACRGGRGLLSAEDICLRAPGLAKQRSLSQSKSGHQRHLQVKLKRYIPIYVPTQLLHFLVESHTAREYRDINPCTLY